MSGEALWTPDLAGAPKVARQRPRFDRRLLVLVLLLPVLVAVWIPLLSGGSAPSAAPAATPAAPPPAAPAGESVAVATAADAAAPFDTRTLLADVRDRIASYEPRWSRVARDPFAVVGAEPPAEAPVPITPTGTTPAAALVPSAVLLSEGQPPIAIVGGRACRPGDDVADCHIVRIEERRVVYRRNGVTFAVAIPSPAAAKERP